MIQVITSDNQHIYGKILEQMFRMRHEYYVLGHGWAGLESHDGREVDEFDNLEAVYLASIDAFGNLAASLRLNPTTGSTLLQKFAAYADGPLPRSDTCWDLSRWIARPEVRRADGKRWPSNHQRELALGVLEFCQSRGADTLTMLCEERLAQRIGAYGWPVTYLGEPRAYEGGKGIAVAARINVGDHILRQTRAKTGLHNPVLFELTPENMLARRQNEEESQTVRETIERIGPENLRDLVELLAHSVSAGASAQAPDTQGRPASLALLAALNRLLELVGAGLDLTPQSETPATKGAVSDQIASPRRDGAARSN